MRWQIQKQVKLGGWHCGCLEQVLTVIRNWIMAVILANKSQISPEDDTPSGRVAVLTF